MSGLKFDGEKLRWDLLPLGPLTEVVEVLTKGAQKYAPNNWQKVRGWRWRYYAAAMRHMVAWKLGEKNDPEMGTHHLANAVCCLLFVIELDRRGSKRG